MTVKDKMLSMLYTIVISTYEVLQHCDEQGYERLKASSQYFLVQLDTRSDSIVVTLPSQLASNKRSCSETFTEFCSTLLNHLSRPKVGPELI
jgi:hypothetical protein